MVFTGVALRVLVVHYRYFVSGGPERYLFNVKRLLEERGHEVVPFSVAFKRNETSEWSPYFVPPIAGDDEVYFDDHTWTPKSLARAFKATFYSPDVYRSLSRLLRDARPDVALVLQFQRKMSPSVLSALHDAHVPIVVRLSDFGMVCPEAHLTRDGELCTDCVGRLPYASVRHACVHGSHLVSAVEFAATAYHRSTRVFDLVDRFIAPTTFMRETMIAAGWPEDKVRVIPTPVALPAPCGSLERDTFVYLGRIDRLKGVFTLIDAYARLVGDHGPGTPGLAFVGSAEGPEGRELKVRVAELGLEGRVTFAGVQDMQGIQRWLCRALASIVPSICCDNLPNSMLESLAAGAPVIASDQPALREALDGSSAGTLVPQGDADALARAMDAIMGDPQRVISQSEAARRLAQRRFSEEAHMEALLHLFGELV